MNENNNSGDSPLFPGNDSASGKSSSGQGGDAGTPHSPGSDSASGKSSPGKGGDAGTPHSPGNDSASGKSSSGKGDGVSPAKGGAGKTGGSPGRDRLKGPGKVPAGGSGSGEGGPSAPSAGSGKGGPSSGEGGPSAPSAGSGKGGPTAAKGEPTALPAGSGEGGRSAPPVGSGKGGPSAPSAGSGKGGPTAAKGEPSGPSASSGKGGLSAPASGKGRSGPEKKAPSGKKGKAAGKGGKGSRGKRGGRRASTRRTNKLSPSLGTLFSWLQVSHLEGLSFIHFRDIEQARELRRPHQVAVDLAELALLFPDKVSELEERFRQERMSETFFRGKGDRPDLVQSFWFGDAGAGFKSLRDGHPGTAVVLPGDAWEKLIREADAARHSWIDGGGKRRTSEALQRARRGEIGFASDGLLPRMSGQLHKAYARMPPWVARIAAKELTADELRMVVEAVSKAFSTETGFRVLAANVHRESEHDLHIHLVYTDLTLEDRVVKPYSEGTLKKKDADLRKLAKASLLVRTGNEDPDAREVAIELERMFQDGELENPRAVRAARNYHRQDRDGFRHHMVAMGPAYVSKAWLWEASGRSAAVAAVNEQKGHNLTFRAVVMEAASREIAPLSAKGPEDVFVDYWLSRRWTEEVLTCVSESGIEEIARDAAQSVARYVDSGRSLPEPLTDSDMALRDRKLEEAENARAAAEASRKELEAEKARLEEARVAWEREVLVAVEPLDVGEVAGKLRFALQPDDDRLFREVEVEGGSFVQRLVIKGRKFALDIPEKLGTLVEGEGAIGLMAAISPKATLRGIVGKLCDWFPSRRIGIVMESLGSAGSAFLRELLAMDGPAGDFPPGAGFRQSGPEGGGDSGEVSSGSEGNDSGKGGRGGKRSGGGGGKASGKGGKKKGDVPKGPEGDVTPEG